VRVCEGAEHTDTVCSVFCSDESVSVCCIDVLPVVCCSDEACVAVTKQCLCAHSGLIVVCCCALLVCAYVHPQWQET
jgi:hypothetical protein